MKKLRFLIIEQSQKENHRDLVRAIQKLGHEVTWHRLDEVVLQTENEKLVAYFGTQRLSDFDIILPRTVSSNLRLGRLVLRLCHKNQYVLDAVICKRDTFGKASQASTLLDAHIPHPKTLYTTDFSQFTKHIRAIHFPCIAKPVRGSQGRGVFLIKNHTEALQLFPTLGEDYLFQEYLPIKFDYRIFIVGKKIIGAMKRFVAPNDIRSNVSIGAETAPMETIPPAMEKIALRAARAFGYDVSGVDIAIINDTHYVLEVNRTPQWQGLKKALNIDPAMAIAEFCIDKYALLQKKQRSVH